MIKDDLKERRMTQKQLAEETGIKTSVLSETINGKRKTVSVTIPIKDRNLLKELVRKFGWACVF